MIYHLLQYLSENYDFPGERLINYISFRSILAIIFALAVALAIGKKAIGILQKRQIGEEIRNLDLEGQLSKKGTPTMGGVIIIISILVSSLLFGDLSNIYVRLLILSTVWLGAIGFADDYIKVFRHRKEGLKGKYKIYGQVSLGIIVGLTMWLHEDIIIREPSAAYRQEDKVNAATEGQAQTCSESEKTYIAMHSHETDNGNSVGDGKVYSGFVDMKTTKTTIPFVKENQFDYEWINPVKGKWQDTVTWIIYVFVIIIVITAVSNGANLTDGLDGLATGTSAVIGITLGILAYLSGNVIYSEYLDIMYIPGSGEVVIFLAAFTGALIGFLWYNTYPAQVFMGDTGSLAIGGIIAVAAIMIRKELLIPVLCGIFLVESLSVIIQTTYFKITKRMYGEGRRIFRMTPLHHHYQKPGAFNGALITSPKNAVPEAKIVTRFWIIGILLAVITVITLKIR